MGQGTTAASSELGRRLIRRPRLMRLLDETPSRCIVLVAPAGYGKTTLARQWLAERDRRGVWFRATSASTDVAALALGLTGAAEEVLRGASERVRERLRTSHSPNEEANQLGTTVGESLLEWPNDVWIVIDDYHHLAKEPAAERFIDALMAQSNVPFLITSRIRPAWVSAKRLLYGEVAEFGRNVLAMTHDEAARAVPRDKESGALAGLVALAEGWPAVIGLASLVKSPFMVAGDEMPEALHSYFAEELYQGISAEFQWNLVQLSLAPTIDVELAAVLFGDQSREVVEEAWSRGFLSRDGGSYDLHPLLRQFLRSKLSNADPRAKAATVESIGFALLRRSAWDEAFDLASEFSVGELLRELLSLALDDLLKKGRLASLEQWIEEAHRLIPGEEIVQLAEIELAFRKGRWPESEDKARHLAQRLPQKHPIASRALFRAAQVAQLDDRPHEALELLSDARVRSTTSSDLRRAAWSRFLSLTDLEEPELAAKALEEFEALPPESVEDVIRLSHGPVHFSVRWGGIREELERHRSALVLLDRTTDPVVRSGFLQSYGTALNLAARYEEASQLADRQIADAKRFGLDWVRAHALELKGLAQIGLKDFEGAHASLRTAYRLAEEASDFHAQVNAMTLIARIPLAQGAPCRALEVLETSRSRAAGPGMEGEIQSMRALIFACMGRLDEAEAEIATSEAITSHLEARGLRAYAGLVVAHRRGEDEDCGKRLQVALRESSNTGNADSFVSAYRASPEILQLIVRHAVPLDEFLATPIRTYDPKLAERAGLSPPVRRAVGTRELTPREEEVLSLVRQGLSNRQIARSLWITESTAKVHVRHIFEKLGVRSRTEAALFRPDPEV
jgi:LuxR family maltose regulon positive regulatory protein